MGKSINYKINTLITFVLLIIFVTVLVVLVITKNNIERRANELLTESEKEQISNLSRLIMSMGEIADDLAKKTLNIAMNNVKEVLKRKGVIAIAGKERISVTNQFTKESSVVDVPKLSIGGNIIPLISSFDQSVPIVDEITKLTGAKATIFVRMNQNGDMVRIATTVPTKDGRRAIQTFIPAINLDGEKNSVVSNILAGEEYTGRAFVVDQWYITKYLPLKSNTGEVIGMIYCGIPQKVFEDKLRQIIYSVKIGETGYVSVLQGSGENKGTYLISKHGQRDGENIWNSKDVNGKFFVQEVINITTQNPGEIYYQRYDWKNIDETKPRTKIVAVVYFKNWDWVISAEAYEDEIFVVRNEIISSLNEGLVLLVIACLAALVVSLILATWIAKRISQPVFVASRIAEAIGKGDLVTAKSLMQDK